MNDYLMEIMKRTSVFMILAQAVIHFRPNPSYEKYFKFLAGVMTIVILVKIGRASCRERVWLKV